MRRLESHQVPVAAFYLRRLLVLGLFGMVAEAAFGFHVLLGYALWGVPLLLLYRLRTRWLLLAAAGGGVCQSGHTRGRGPSLVAADSDAGKRQGGSTAVGRCADGES